MILFVTDKFHVSWLQPYKIPLEKQSVLNPYDKLWHKKDLT